MGIFRIWCSNQYAGCQGIKLLRAILKEGQGTTSLKWSLCAVLVFMEQNFEALNLQSED